MYMNITSKDTLLFCKIIKQLDIHFQQLQIHDLIYLTDQLLPIIQQTNSIILNNETVSQPSDDTFAGFIAQQHTLSTKQSKIDQQYVFSKLLQTLIGIDTNQIFSSLETSSSGFQSKIDKSVNAIYQILQLYNSRYNLNYHNNVLCFISSFINDRIMDCFVDPNYFFTLTCPNMQYDIHNHFFLEILLSRKTLYNSFRDNKISLIDIAPNIYAEQLKKVQLQLIAYNSSRTNFSKHVRCKKCKEFKCQFIGDKQVALKADEMTRIVVQCFNKNCMFRFSI